MRNVLGALIPTALLVSCASVAHLERTLPLLNGQPAEEAIAAFGTAYHRVDTPTGEKYTWIRRINRSTAYIPGAGAMIPVSAGGGECTLTIYLDSSGNILYSSYSGHNLECATFDYSLRKHFEAKT